MLRYQKVFGDLEDYAHALGVSKSREAYFRTATEQEPIEGAREVQLEDGTKTTEKVRGIRFSTSITLTALGVLNPVDAKVQGASLNPVNPDVQLVFTAPIAAMECFSADDKKAFDAEVEANWKSVLNEVKKQYGGAFFEGVVSIIG